MSVDSRAEWAIKAITEDDRDWAVQLMIDQWGGALMVTRGRTHSPAELPGFVAWMDGQRVGLLTYEIKGGACEVVSLDSLRNGLGIGTGLVQAVKDAARQQGCRRLWLITTNDNLDALRFYQKRGFAIAAVHRDAISASRMIKPSIPETGAYGIPIRDEIEMEIQLKG